MTKHNKSLSWLSRLIIGLGFLVLVVVGHNLPMFSQEAPLVLRVGTEPTFPPFQMQNQQTREIEGFDIDIFNAVGKEAGFTINIQALPFDSLIPALQSRQIDAAISGMTITAQRALAVDFSRPYFRSGLGIAVQQGNTEIKEFADLKNKKVAVQIGTTSAKEAARIPGATVRTFDNTVLSLQELVNGNVDAVMNDEPAILFALKQSNMRDRVKMVGTKLTEEFYGIAFPKGSPNVKIVNAGLDAIIANGVYKEIYQKWFSGIPPELPDVAPGLADTKDLPEFSITQILPALMYGTLITLGLSVASIVLGMIGGTIIALMQISNNSVLKTISKLYIDFFRGTPLLVQLFLIYFGIPAVVQQKLGMSFSLDPFTATVIALSMNAAAFLGEIIRGGIESVDRGQWEAAECLGMDPTQSMKDVIFPQAFRRMLPPLGNEFITLVKDTSLAATIGFEELFRRGQLGVANTFRAFEIYITVALIYLVLTYALSRLFAWLEVKMNPVEQAKKANARKATA